MKQITLTEAVAMALDQEQKVYMIIPVAPTTMIEELAAAAGFCCKDEKDGAPKEEEKPAAEKPKEKKLDHGKIIACHKAGWPVAKIADEVGCSGPTVRAHITRWKEEEGQA